MHGATVRILKLILARRTKNEARESSKSNALPETVKRVL
jgi:hypothetical protein